MFLENMSKEYKTEIETLKDSNDKLAKKSWEPYSCKEFSREKATKLGSQRYTISFSDKQHSVVAVLYLTYFFFRDTFLRLILLVYFF